MTSAAPPRFDLDALRRLAGDKVFARGEAYHRDDRVEILSMGPGRVLASVSGSEDYRAVLAGSGKRIGGDCDCPAFADWGFCKHLVAVALAANEAGDDGAAAGESPVDRIRRHLERQDVATLVGIIVDLAERDPALLRRLDLAAAAETEDDDVLQERVRKAIDAATRTRGFVDYREAPDWAAEVDSVLDAIAALAAVGRAAAALPLIDRALSRIESALDEADDSDGLVGGLLIRARDIHLAACRAAPLDPETLARDLFEREMAGPWGAFHGAAHLYAEVLGEAGLAEYRRLAEAAWEQVPVRSGGKRTGDDVAADRMRLEAILDAFAARDGDVAARIALRAKDVSSPWRYLDLARFCLDHGREAEALSWAEEGLWQFEDAPPDRRLVAFTADLLHRAGRDAAAADLLGRTFERAPDFDLYRRLRETGGAAARDRALDVLREDLAKPCRGNRPRPSADLLVRVLVAEEMFAEAWEVARKQGVSERVLDTLALASEAGHPAEALAAHTARIDRLVSTGGNANYGEAHDLLARMARLRPAEDQAAHVADLKTRFKAKRNFMKLLRDGEHGAPAAAHTEAKP